MRKVLHISTECFPAAKVGGMGDVVGSLPLYLHKQQIDARVIIPKYKNRWLQSQNFKPIHSADFQLGDETIAYSIQQLLPGENNQQISYPFYCIDIPGKFDRENIYLGDDGHGYHDEIQRYLSFQIAVVDWLSNCQNSEQFSAVHCHDHMTGLIPFFMQYAHDYRQLSHIPSFFTIHNGQYRGTFDWAQRDLLPAFDDNYEGLLDWDNSIHSLATAIKCAWQVTTVSPTYMNELKDNSGTLTPLLQQEKGKCTGILNGIDSELWNPQSDPYLDKHLNGNQWVAFKTHHKKKLLERFHLKGKTSTPLLSFIGRFAYEKGADLLAPVFECLLKQETNINIVVLGSGDKSTELQIQQVAQQFPDVMASVISYDEALAREIYAASDFLLMPSRFEPCGLNQLFSMRYGTVPVVRATGGLIDTVPDISTADGHGITFADADVDDVSAAIQRASALYQNKAEFNKVRQRIVKLDYSWNKSALDYSKLYLAFNCA